MKLRNKKTGKIVELDHFSMHYNRPEEWGYQPCSTWNHSLAELNEEWEDYKPKEPLIKDEKIRKAVRAWAEANGIERVWHEYASCWLRGNGLMIELENEVAELEQDNYSIAELCEEEAPEPLEPSFIDLDERTREKEDE